MKRAVEELQNEYGQDRILLDMNDQYYNMREKIEPVIEIVNIAKQAMKTSASNRRFPPSAAEPTDHSCPTWGFRRQTSLQAGKTSTANLNTSQLTTWSKP
ncbi:peptidase T [Bacillus subtilis]|nr:peptidase T [Bacillus subtilis]